MIDAIVKVAEKIAELLKYRELKREKRFKALIEPMFAAMQEVHTDYLTMFDQVRQDLAANMSLSEIAPKLASRRLLQEGARRTIESQAEEALMGQPGPDSADREFMDAVRDYFAFTPLASGMPISLSNRLATWLEKIEERTESGRPVENQRESALDAVEAGLHDLRRRWQRVISAYAAALTANL
ncbi:MAG: hypothetical protein EON92_11775 [Burkholderiales bacterium]|nr:MAG: hypothetical protein EON92_11775 [Burkholderiales bacterium]